MEVIIFLFIGLFSMWYALHVILYSDKEQKKKVTYFLAGSIILYFSLSCVFLELLNFKK
ncbi:hypothetical protein [Staphylococcus pseudintermedius]|uniref:hypothetical protein n=1 Tax=Staphylococcus pseudintermedius TaxID=283734 RepID=UPI00193336AE|nr:hypothetical protein [Staphylococcus pseudintermedius]HDV5978572.1 hypothetical protein [Staphylococcus pseudintermedius]